MFVISLLPSVFIFFVSALLTITPLKYPGYNLGEIRPLTKKTSPSSQKRPQVSP